MKRILLFLSILIIALTNVWAKKSLSTPPVDAPKITLTVQPGSEFYIDFTGLPDKDITIWVESDGVQTPIEVPKGVEEGQLLQLRTVKDNTIILHGDITRMAIEAQYSQISELNADNNNSIQRVSLYLTPISKVSFRACKNLDLLYVRECATSEIDITGCSSLAELKCNGNNDLSTLDITQCPALEDLECEENQIEVLDFSNCPKIKTVNAAFNAIKSLDFSNNPLLELLDVDSNQIEDLKIDKCTSLKELIIEDNQLTSIDVSKNTKLTKLQIGENKIQEVDLTGLTELIRFHCPKQEGGMEKVDLTPCTKLQYVVTYENRMKELKLPASEDLLRIECYDEELKSLDISKNKNLTELFCENNKIESINTKDHLKLLTFRARNNPLKSLDLSNSPDLVRLEMKGTPSLSEIKVAPELKKANWIELNGCKLDACAIDFVVKALNDTFVEEQPNLKKLFIANNPGTATCNTKAATDKHWVVDAQGDGTGCPQSTLQPILDNIVIGATSKGAYIYSDIAVETTVYTVTGEVATRAIVEGATLLPLAQGSYIVQAGNKAKKIIVQ